MIKWNTVTSKKIVVVALKHAVKEISKEILSLKVACLRPIDYIECPKTNEIAFGNKIQLFCRELNGRIFQNSKDW